MTFTNGLCDRCGHRLTDDDPWNMTQSGDLSCIDCLTDDERKFFGRKGAWTTRVTEDAVNHPSHYKHLPVEAIEITENFNFCIGNAIKYLIRCDHKGNAIQDLKKAAWYVQREITRRENGGKVSTEPPF